MVRVCGGARSVRGFHLGSLIVPAAAGGQFGSSKRAETPCETRINEMPPELVDGPLRRVHPPRSAGYSRHATHPPRQSHRRIQGHCFKSRRSTHSAPSDVQELAIEIALRTDRIPLIAG